MPKPTIAMLNGVAAGAGMSLALACDLRIAAQSAHMTTAFAKVGLSGDYGGTYFLTRLVGSVEGARTLPHRRKWLDVITDQRSLWALVSKVVPDASLVHGDHGAGRTSSPTGPRVAYHRYSQAQCGHESVGGGRARSVGCARLPRRTWHAAACRDTADPCRSGAGAFVRRRRKRRGVQHGR